MARGARRGGGQFLKAASRGGRGSVTLEGALELVQKLRGLEDSMAGAELLESTMEGAEVVRRSASEKAPRRTGTLARNIDKEAVKASRDRAVVHVGPNKIAWYGIFPEIGTSKQSAKPFLRPALDENRARVVDTIRDSLRRRLKGAL